MAAGKGKKELERVEDTPVSVEVFESDIALYLRMFCEEYGIEDMSREPQSRWNGMLSYVRKRVFSDINILKSKEIVYDSASDVPSNFNAYDYKLLNDICDIYIDLCLVYDKEVSIIGFSRLTGINQDTIHDWGKGSTTLSTLSSEIYKKLHTYREESLSNKLTNSRANVVGVLGILNHWYQWNLPGVSKEKAVSTARKPEEIEQMYGNGAKTALPELPKDD